jgi:HD-GYP domain-containing protein (c-di-GMP phosphodiesterase class II)
VTNNKDKMAEPIGILIFNKNEEERRALSILMKTEDNRVFDTSDALEALHLLQKDNIGVILAGHETGIARKEFKSLIDKIKPGVSVIFTSPFSPKEKEFSVNIEEFLKLINDYLKNETMLFRDLGAIRQFSYTLADRLLQIFAVNDKYFFNNDHLVAELSGKIAEKMGLEEDIIEAIRMAALLRDLGRVVIHQQILEETKKLNQTELTPIKAHPIHTMQILRHVRFPWNLDTIISQHHEHYDGSGYPLGLKGREISIGARIINVVDAYYAITTDRPYRRALPKDKAVSEIKRNAGSQFDPEVVEIFLSVIGEEVAETAPKKRVLIFERELNVAAMIKLGTALDEIEVIHATSSIEAISRIRQKNPQVIVADTDALEFETFRRFYHTARQTMGSDRHFLLLVPDKDFISRFNERVDYVVKPINMEQITLKIKGLLFDVPLTEPLEEMRGLTGRLEDFNLTDIIQILSLGLKTAKVEITRDGDKGLLYLLRGKIVHASAGNLRGPEAFFELIRWERGTFHILHGQNTNEVNVTLDTMHLLMEACTILDEKQTTKGPQLQKYSKIY